MVKHKVIVDTDTKNEIDDQWALAYALRSPGIEVIGITAVHFNRDGSQPWSMESSYEEIEKILDLTGDLGSVPIYRGLPERLDLSRPVPDCEAVDYMIETAMNESGVTIVAIGALTNVAAACLKRPEIASRIALYWLGGGPWPGGGDEFNQMNDIEALRVLLDAQVEFHWVTALGVCSRLKVSREGSEKFVKGRGAIGDYLHELLAEYPENPKPIWDLGPFAALMHPEWFTADEIKSPLVLDNGSYQEHPKGRAIQVYKDVEASLVIEDFLIIMQQYPVCKP